MPSGRIRQISRYRGFGFIRSDTGSNVFFRRTDLKGVTFDVLKEGQRVQFSVGLSLKGFHAHNVELVKQENLGSVGEASPVN